MSVRIPSIVILAAVLVAPSCKKDQSTAAPVKEKDTPEAYQAYDPPPMDLHYLKVNQIHDAVVKGDLDVAKATAKWIVENTVKDEMPIKWRPNVPPVVDAATDVVEATDLETASKGLAELGNACGKCHAAMGIEMEIPDKAPPPEADDAAAHMKRHQWGVQRMWEGLVAPSDDAWTRGAKALAEAPLEVTSDTAAEKKEGQGIADQVHGLGTAALGQTVPDERASTYGQLIYTCSKCHSGGG